MLLHGTYDNGKIRIKEKNLPKIKTDVEIIVKNTLSRKIKKIKPSGKNISSAVIEERYER